MDRRTVLTAATAAAPLLLLSLSHKALAQAGSVAIDTDQHQNQTLSVGSLSLQTSILAMDRAQHPRVKQFAEFERDEQLTLAQVLTDTQSPKLTALTPADEVILHSLGGLSGSQFDLTYIRDQMQIHQQLLRIQQDFLRGSRASTRMPST